MTINLNDLYDKKYINEYVSKNLFFGDENFERYIRSITDEQKRSEEYVKQLGFGVKNKAIDVDIIGTCFHNIIQSSITNALRPTLYECIIKLNDEMSEYGKFIVSGGEAFNMNVTKNNRRVTPDIDTKFIPMYGKIDEKKFKNIDENERKIFFKKYYGFTLNATEHMWYVALNSILDKLNDPNFYAYMYYNIFVKLENTFEFKLLQVKFNKPIKDAEPIFINIDEGINRNIYDGGDEDIDETFLEKLRMEEENLKAKLIGEIKNNYIRIYEEYKNKLEIDKKNKAQSLELYMNEQNLKREQIINYYNSLINKEEEEFNKKINITYNQFLENLKKENYDQDDDPYELYEDYKNKLEIDKQGIINLYNQELKKNIYILEQENKNNNVVQEYLLDIKKDEEEYLNKLNKIVKTLEDDIKKNENYIDYEYEMFQEYIDNLNLDKKVKVKEYKKLLKDYLKKVDKENENVVLENYRLALQRDEQEYENKIFEKYKKLELDLKNDIRLMEEYIREGDIEKKIKILEEKNLKVNLENLIIYNVKEPEFKDLQTDTPFKKRLTILSKNTDVTQTFFFDIQLFAVDLYLHQYLYPSSEYEEFGFLKFTLNNNLISGVLDLPFMKPGQFGYSIGQPRENIRINTQIGEQNINYNSSLNIFNEYKPNKRSFSLLYASTLYLTEDINDLIKYKLRANKSEKDILRQKILADPNNIINFLDKNDYDNNNANMDLDIQVDPNMEIEEIKNSKNELLKNYLENNINPLKISKIIKYTAPPINTPLGKNKEGLINNCCDTTLEVRMATKETFDYKTGTWKECCDEMSNQFVFRIDSKELGLGLGFSKNSEEYKKSYSTILDILKSLLTYTNKWNKNKDNPKNFISIKNDLGKMLYNYNPELNNCVLTSTLIQNIRIFTYNILYDPREEYQNIGVKIDNNLLSLYNYYKSIENVDSACNL